MSTTIPAEFHEAVRQALKCLYDVAQLRKTAALLARAGGSNIAAMHAQQLQREIIRAVDTLRPEARTDYLAADARLFNLVHGHYVEGMGIEQAARENAVSVRQAHRDLRRGEEAITLALWERWTGKPAARVAARLASDTVAQEVAEIARRREPVDLSAVLQRALDAVGPLAQQETVALALQTPPGDALASGSPAVASQLLVSLLSAAVQRARRGSAVEVALETTAAGISVDIAWDEEGAQSANAAPLEAALTLAGYLGWRSATARAGRVTIVAPPAARQVLVVDDNEGLIHLMSHYLGEHGYAVSGCTHSAGAVAEAAALKPSFIILDVMMPGQDGWQVLKMLKGSAATRAIPVVICSVFDDKALARSLGACHYMTKPVTRSAIEAMLDALAAVGRET